jgi:hypothetical protein
VTPIFFLNKLSRMPLTYLYTDHQVGPAIMTEGILSGLLLLGNVLVLHSRKSKRLIITSYSVMNYLLILLVNYLTQSLLGMMLISSIATFNFIYMKILMVYLISISVKESRLINCLYPFLYLVLVVGNLLKVYLIDANSQSFAQMVFVFLIIQGLGFLFISGINIRKFKDLCHLYSQQQEALNNSKHK